MVVLVVSLDPERKKRPEVGELVVKTGHQKRGGTSKGELPGAGFGSKWTNVEKQRKFAGEQKDGPRRRGTIAHDA